MKIRVATTWLAFTALIAFGGVAAAQTGSYDQTQQKKDASFAKDAAAGGMAEVQLGKLAQQKGSSQSVKDFGARMVKDHSAANDKLKAVASKDGMMVPSGMTHEDQATYDKLSKLSGSDFDKAYAQDMVQDHQKDIAAFQKEANGGMNPDLKNFASQTLPTLQDHLQMAQQMQQSVGGQ